MACSRLILALLSLGFEAPRSEAAETVASPKALTFERDVRPILKAHCFHCHGEDAKPKAKLDLRMVKLMNRGGESGPAIVPGKRVDSLLWEMIDADEMPPVEKKLTAQEKARIGRWLDQGAATARPEPEEYVEESAFTEEERSFWSFQPIRPVDVPRVRASDRVRTPLDSFVLEKLEARGLGFAADAKRGALIRRVTFDLTGLPPSPEDVDAFMNDPRADAYERLVDRLLGSTQYGERQARHWMDVAGYADSDGYTAQDTPRHYAYKYRDYLIRSLNADRPWDDLIREQLAGDEMLTPPYLSREPEDVDKLVATGFLRLAPDGTGDSSTDAVTARNDAVAEEIKVVSSAFLGLTVGCAQCHSHRYDPISQVDYYRFRALFDPAFDPSNWRVPNARLISLWTDTDRKRAEAVDAELRVIDGERSKAFDALVTKVVDRELAAAPADLRDRLRKAQSTAPGKRSADETGLLKQYPRVDVNHGNVYLYEHKAVDEINAANAKRVAAAQARRPAENFVQALTEVPGKAPVSKLLSRGDPKEPRQEVAPGELAVLTASAGHPSIPSDDPALPTTGRRLAYARHLTNGKHPLVARVLVNRVWMNLFGKGIVATPADFGALGARPTHPELLDWLALEFMRGGWTLKRMHRLIVTSTVYRQSAARESVSSSSDPDNTLLGRTPIRRLDAESVRDAMLAVSGKLHTTMCGPPIPVRPDEAGQFVVGIDTRDSAGRPSGKFESLGPDEFRRGVYLQVRRTMPLSLLETFDAPVMTPNCERRTFSTVAPQALMLMNNEFVVEQAAAFAARLERDAGKDHANQVRRAWKIAYALEPSPRQVEAAVDFLSRQESDLARVTPSAKNPDSPQRLALTSFCQALLSSNAFLYTE